MNRVGHEGRGESVGLGWFLLVNPRDFAGTWYTGAAGWLYRTGLEWILGFRKRGSALRIDPCIPRNWERFEIT